MLGLPLFEPVGRRKHRKYAELGGGLIENRRNWRILGLKWPIYIGKWPKLVEFGLKMGYLHRKMAGSAENTPN
jgi:hypothetical protein